MTLTVQEVSEIRAKIAKQTVWEQVTHSCEAIRALPPGQILIPDIDQFDPNLQKPAPGFEDIGQLPPEDVKLEHYASDVQEAEDSQGSLKKAPVTFDIGIIGAGMAGLYTAMILRDLGLNYHLIEATSESGGRVFTYKFSKDPGDYYDVGAMRFPNIPIMRRTFKLFKTLDIPKDESLNPAQGTLIPYHFSGPNNFRVYNNIRSEVNDIKEDTFHVSVSKRGTVPDNYVKQGYQNILKELFDNWKKHFVNDFKGTWKKLMVMDAECISLRSYIIKNYAMDPARDVYYMSNWLETMDSASTHYDEAFTSHLLSSLEFNFPSTPERAENPQPITGTSEENIWWCINGGASQANEVTTKLPPGDDGKPRFVKRDYSHVITTTTAARLRVMDLSNAGLNYAQREAIRVLKDNRAIKVGIKFSTRWWALSGTNRGGLGKTDRPTRIVVYPSYALDTDPEKPGVLLACYNSSQDAGRLGGLMRGESKPTEQEAILTVILEDLAVLHGMDATDLRGRVLSYHVHDWNRDEIKGGAFSSFGPGQFSSFFGHIQRPAADGRLFVAGDLTSVYHGWIAGSLNSAYRVVHQMLLAEYLRAGKNPVKRIYILLLLLKLRIKWSGSPFEPEPEYDSSTDGSAIATWQVFLGMLGLDV